MLELHDVVIEPRRQTISLTLDDGRLALLSASKRSEATAVLRAVMGLQPIAGGHISIDGELLTPLSASYFRHDMAYVPSRLVLIPGQDRVCDVYRMVTSLEANKLSLEKNKDTRLWTSMSPAARYLELLRCVAQLKRRLVLVDAPMVELTMSELGSAIALFGQMTEAGSSVLAVSNRLPSMHITENITYLNNEDFQR